MAEKLKFSTNTRDGKELKLYIEGGACDGLKPMEVLKKFPQFQRYENKKNHPTFLHFISTK